MPTVELSEEEVAALYQAARYPISMETGLTDAAKSALEVLQEEILVNKLGFRLTSGSCLTRKARIEILLSAAKDEGLELMEDLPI